mmetsp:Transcript_118839/g.341198  ORF Transcript_118839/g.341198 Transcript_118839/m.341198 type:complete len:223 (-) Transcript_118839:233-901(-)
MASAGTMLCTAPPASCGASRKPSSTSAAFGPRHWSAWTPWQRMGKAPGNGRGAGSRAEWQTKPTSDTSRTPTTSCETVCRSTSRTTDWRPNSATRARRPARRFELSARVTAPRMPSSSVRQAIGTPWSPWARRTPAAAGRSSGCVTRTTPRSFACGLTRTQRLSSTATWRTAGRGSTIPCADCPSSPTGPRITWPALSRQACKSGGRASSKRRSSGDTARSR